MPLLRGPFNLSGFELGGRGSIEDLLSLKTLAGAVEGLVLPEGELLQQLSPELREKSLGSLFAAQQLPQTLLQQPMGALLSSSSSSKIPTSLLHMNLGDFLSLSSSIDDFLKTPLLQIPPLQQLVERGHQLSPWAAATNSSSSSSRSSNNHLRQREQHLLSTAGLLF